MEEQTESWQLRSGTWHRDRVSESWRLAATGAGTMANARLSIQDLGRMIAAKRDAASGQWFPADFDYSPRTGARLHVTVPCLDSPWVPPFGAAALSDIGKPSARGLRQTPASLSLAGAGARFDPAGEADRTLPALPPGQYRFLVHKFDVASPTLMAVEPQRGSLLLLLPESKTWVPLEPPASGMLAECQKDARGWRMEVVEQARGATLYCPTARGLAVVTPTLIGLSYALAYFGDGPALGGPVAWAGEVWLPVRGGKGAVKLVAKPPGAAKPMVLATPAPAPENGFEAPVFDPLRVIWPSEEGQLIVRLTPEGRKETAWIAWPDGLRPAFALGCPYLSLSGVFWQPCWRGHGESLEYVQMGKTDPERAAVDAPLLGTGRISYKKEQRIDGDPWREPEHAGDGSSSRMFVPLIEAEIERTVAGLKMEAPQGVRALLASGKERHRAVLQLRAENGAEVSFGALDVCQPWLASFFVYDAHLWVYHPELPHALGWKLGS